MLATFSCSFIRHCDDQWMLIRVRLICVTWYETSHMVAADCLMLFGAMASETTWLTHKWQPTAITLWCSSVIYQQHHKVMISACHQPVNCIGVYTAVARWSSWPWPPCQPSRVTPCFVICAVSPPGRLAECRRRHLAGETGHLSSFSPARCRLQPVRRAPPRGGGDSYWQPAVALVMAGQHPTVHRSERIWAHFCSERCIEGCLTDTLWDLQDWSTAITVWLICPNCFAVLTISIFVWRYDICYLLYSVQTK